MKEEFNVPLEIKEDSTVPFDTDLSKLGAKLFNKKL
jgi:hypothetical protein